MVYRRACRPGSPFPSLPAAICAVVAFLLMALMVLARPSPQTPLHTALTPEVLGTLAAGGALAGVAMIIPGTSGSFVLLVIGLYRTAVQAVADLNIPLIAPLAAGAVFGLFAGAALVRYLLAKAPRVTYGTVLGLVAGSLIVLFPGGLGSGIGAAVSLAAAFAGFFVSYAAGRERNTAV
jgi:putative membrane protein